MARKTKQISLNTSGLSILDNLKSVASLIPNEDTYLGVKHNLSQFILLFESLLTQTENTDSLCPSFNPINEEGEKYLKVAQELGVDPIFFGMIVKNEWNHRAIEQIFPFFTWQIISDEPSFGTAQIQGGTAITTMQNHPELFSPDNYPQLYINGELDLGRIQWELFVNESFNLQVAAALISDLQAHLTNALAESNIVVSDIPIERQVTITHELYNQLIAVNYNQGEAIVIDGLTGTKYTTPEEKLDALIRTLELTNTHIQNVFSNREYVEEVLGVEWLLCDELEGN